MRIQSLCVEDPKLYVEDPELYVEDPELCVEDPHFTKINPDPNPTLEIKSDPELMTLIKSYFSHIFFLVQILNLPLTNYDLDVTL